MKRYMTPFSRHVLRFSPRYGNRRYRKKVGLTPWHVAHKFTRIGRHYSL